jgi:hypothetical protein
MRAATSLILE